MNTITLPFTSPDVPSVPGMEIPPGIKITGEIILPRRVARPPGSYLGSEARVSIPIRTLKEITIKDYDADTQEWVAGLLTYWNRCLVGSLGSWLWNDHTQKAEPQSCCCLGYRILVDRKPTYTLGICRNITSGQSSEDIRDVTERVKFGLHDRIGGIRIPVQGMYLPPRSSKVVIRLVSDSPKGRVFIDQANPVRPMGVFGKGFTFEPSVSSLAALNDYFSSLVTSVGGVSVSWIIIHTILSHYPWLFLRLPKEQSITPPKKSTKGTA